MSTSVKQTLKSLVTRQDAQPAKFTAQGCRCLGRDTPQNECRKRFEDVMMADASTATRVKATRVRQTERNIQDVGDSEAGEPPAVRVDLVNTNAFDSETRSTWTRNLKGTQKCRLAGQEAPVTRERSAGADAECLEEGDEFACGIVAQGR